MIIYLGMVAASLLFAQYAANAKPYPLLAPTYRLLAVLSAAPFLLVTVLRYRVGTDWTYVYEPYFYYIRNGIARFSEPGFTLLYRVFGLFTDDAWWVIAFVGAATVALFFAAIYQQSCRIPFSILLFFILNKYFTALNQIRQMLAMAMFIYSLKHVQSRNWKGYFAWNLAGAAIHTSSFMYLPLYFLYGFRLTARRCLALLAAAAATFPLLRAVVPWLVLHTRFGWYLKSAFQQNNFYLIGFVQTLLFTLLHVLCLYRSPERDEKFEFWSSLMALSAAALLYSAALPQILRLSEGLSVVQIFSFPRMLEKEKDGRVRFFLRLMIVGLCTAKLFWDVYKNRWYDVLPYQTIFSR